MLKSCANHWCKQSFEVTSDDRQFLDRLSPVIAGVKQDLPEPTLCPECRLQRRLAWRMERTLYFRKCDLTGKDILSIVAPGSKHKAYSPEAWYGDKWNPLDYGREYDFSKPFFTQFAALLDVVPLLAVNVAAVQNCDYVNQTAFSKNCYFTIEADENQDAMYSFRIFFSRSCVDCLEVTQCELCYECIDCDRCFSLRFSQQCSQCIESTFLFDCRGCTSCFGCTGLRQKKYCLFNQQLSKEQYDDAMKQFDFCDEEHMAAARTHFEALTLQLPRKCFIGEQNDNVSGNYIYESKDCVESFGLRGCRDCRHCNLIRSAKDCMDYYVWGEKAEKIYECECCGVNIQSLNFCCDCWEGSHDLLYCLQCVLSSSNCFGCIGLQHGSYCILNTQYTKEQYEELVPKIIEHMKQNGEWGEFFPMTISPYAYNETSAADHFPLSREQITEKGLQFKEDLPFTTGKETITWDKVPADIKHVPDSITNEVFACEATRKNFRITSKELQFYRDWGVPLPHFHQDERHRRRMAKRNPNVMYDRTCATCSKPIQTTYNPERLEKVVCEECYLKEVY